MARDQIDAAEAARLKATGLKWREVAEQLSIDAERHPGFSFQSVSAAVYRANRDAKGAG